MATTGQYFARSFLAGEDLSEKKWHFVTLETDGKVDIADADAEDCIGVAMTNPNAENKAVTVALWGIVKVEAGGTIAIGDEIATNNAGEAIDKNDSASATARTLGVALSGAADGEYVEILLLPPYSGAVTDES